MEFDHFKRTHGSQLSRVPAMYWETLHRKLKCEVSGRVVVQLGAAIDTPLPSSLPSPLLPPDL